jgi:hypothetical protein
MKRYILFLMFGLFAVNLLAQNTNQDSYKQRWGELIAKQAAFYTEHIGLTGDEARKFWPVYYELQRKKDAIHKKNFAQFQNAKKDKNGCRIFNYTKVTDDMINMKVQEVALDKAYHEKFKRILSPEKLFKYYNTERDWAGQLLRDIERRGGK